MFNYNIINKPKITINDILVDKILKNIDKVVTAEQNWTINIVFLDDDSIKKLNNKYRKINKTTDVLSFHYFEDFSNIETDEISGEIIMSENKIIEQWKTYSLWSEREFYKLFIHSILHILWYDHENENEYNLMQDLENKIYDNCIWLIKKNK